MAIKIPLVVTNGQVEQLQSGDSIAGGSTNVGTATISFGSTRKQEGTVAVTGQTGILSTSSVQCFVTGGDSTASNNTTDHQFAAISFRLTTNTPTAGVGFTIYVTTIAGGVTGDFKIRWAWN